MNLLKRLHNIWLLSEMNVVKNIDLNGESYVSVEQTAELEIEKPKQAKIIKMSSPIKEFLKNEDSR